MVHRVGRRTCDQVVAGSTAGRPGCPCVLVLVSRRLKTGSILGLGLSPETSDLGLGKLVLAPEVLVLVLCVYSS